MKISDVARLAGVSNAAVSRYFNNGYISDEKREAIQRVVEETGYRPSIQAKQLRTKRTQMIGVIAPKVASHAVSRIVDGILSVLNQSDYRMLLAVTQNDENKELQYLEEFDNREVDGVILIATIFTSDHKKVIDNMSIPVVIVGQRLENHFSIYHDDYNSIFDITSMVLDKGRKKPVYIGVSLKDKAAGEARFNGFTDALKKRGLGSLIDRTAFSDFTVNGGCNAMKELWAKYPDLDSVICATDQIAFGALEFLKSIDIAVPEQVFITGHGGSELPRLAGHGMVTVSYKYSESGELAAGKLLEVLENNKKLPDENIRLDYTIILP